MFDSEANKADGFENDFASVFVPPPPQHPSRGSSSSASQIPISESIAQASSVLAKSVPNVYSSEPKSPDAPNDASKDDSLAMPSSSSNGTRVFKKSSPNGKITIYIGKRDFIDYNTHVDPVDGVVLVDPEYVNSSGGQQVYVSVLAAFRYGREDLDLLGLTFRKDLYLSTHQVFPPPDEEYDLNFHLKQGTTQSTAQKIQRANWHQKQALTKLQERLLRKLGANAYPFFFSLPSGASPASVTLQPAPCESGKPCGVDYELKAFMAPNSEEKPSKRDVIRLAIRKLYYAPTIENVQPSIEVQKEFVMSPGRLHLELSLDKEMYYHGESIAVNVQITNNSNKTVKKIKLSVAQWADICLFSYVRYKCVVADVESDHCFPVGPGFTLSKVYWLTPLLANNRDKRGLALDGKLKHEDTNLASSTPVPKHATAEQRENLGIIVSYRVRAKLIIGGIGGGDLVAEVPFTLTHPKPENGKNDEIESLEETKKDNGTQLESVNAAGDTNSSNHAISAPDVDLNLIELEEDVHADHASDLVAPASVDASNVIATEAVFASTKGVGSSDDVVFDDFARLRLGAGHEGATQGNIAEPVKAQVDLAFQ